VNSKVIVREALSTKGFKGSRVVSGHAGLNNVVKMVTVAEVPDAMDWLLGGELVMTTAYYLKDDPKALEKWVNGLIEHGAVALAIKSSRFIGVIPEVIRKIGEERAFPIIELPPNITWPEIIESVNNLIAGRQEGVLDHTEQIQNKLMKLVIESKGLNAIAETLSDLINNPVIIEDRWFNTMSISSPVNADDEYLLKVRTAPEYLEILAKAYDPDRYGEEIYQEIMVQTPLKTVKQAIFPVMVENKVAGYLTVLMSGEELTEKEHKVIRYGIMVIALEFSKHKMMIEAYGKLRLDILRALLDNEELERNELRKKALLIGFDLKGPLRAVLIKQNNAGDYVGTGSAHQSFPSDWMAMSIRKKLEEYDNKAFVITRQDDMVAFLHTKTDRAAGESDLKRFLKEECFEREDWGRTLRCGIGNAYLDIEDYKKSFREAEFVVNIGAVFRLESVVSYADLGFYRILGRIEDKKVLQDYWRDLLGPLILYDEENKGDLLLTLEKFLLYNGNQAEVARQMYLHVNTIPYRVKKIEDLLGIDLNRADVRVTLFLALSIFKNNDIK
jgi:purine catabolism regulator